MVLTLDPAPNAPSYSNPDTFEPDTSNYLAWMKAIRNQLSGKALEIGDFGLGGAAASYSGSVDDATLPTGHYFAESTSTGAKPASFGFLLIERRTTGDRGRQIWTNDTGQTWVRVYAGGAWTAWKRLDPESGSNANGEYVRFTDGTQLCWHPLISSGTADLTWTFPAAFLNSATISPQITPLSSGLGIQEPHVSSLTATALTFHVTNGSTRLAVGCRLFAVGRYK